ncbi:MAG: hypothetical protein PHF86_03290 [Candidatus Nanoarchaeia archaeon]|jgi:hypothetical protein|nr:hypothetical protein [Candidatus Nanoarchaeia archaeon]
MIVQKEVTVKLFYDTDSKTVVSSKIQETIVSWTKWVDLDGHIIEIKPILPDTIILCLTDSDLVYDAGCSTKRYSEHKITENHDGTCNLYCPTINHVYKHSIQVPNKNELICRGCGKIV